MREKRRGNEQIAAGVHGWERENGTRVELPEIERREEKDNKNGKKRRKLKRRK